MAAYIVDGRKIAQKIREKVKEEIAVLHTKYGVSPLITTIKIGDNPESNMFLRLKNKACEEVGISSHLVELDGDVAEQHLLDTINEVNKDPSVHGVVVQFPLPDLINQTRVTAAIDPSKDVEGLTPWNMGCALSGDEHLVPCTPLSVVTILEHENIRVQGKDVVIINHSTIVGKPLAALLLNRNATVSICHVYTKQVQRYTAHADVLITATGLPKLITPEYVKAGACVVDVGIAKTKDGVCGDVDFELVKEKAGMITPVPGGVGPVTVACTLTNMLTTYKTCIQRNKK